MNVTILNGRPCIVTYVVLITVDGAIQNCHVNALNCAIALNKPALQKSVKSMNFPVACECARLHTHWWALFLLCIGNGN